jgi:hypothetical protein
MMEEDGLINKLEMDLRSYIYRMLGDNEEHLHRHDLFSNAYSARGVLNQHPAIGYSHPLETLSAPLTTIRSCAEQKEKAQGHTVVFRGVKVIGSASKPSKCQFFQN